MRIIKRTKLVQILRTNGYFAVINTCKARGFESGTKDRRSTFLTFRKSGTCLTLDCYTGAKSIT